MSVLQFSRRSDVIAEEPQSVEIAKPIPLKIRSVKLIKSSPVSRKIRNILIVFLLIIAALAYPLLIMNANRIGDDLAFPGSIAQNWSSPWAGVGAQLLERESNKNGWVADAPNWAPEARLNAMPSYQMALAHAIGDFVELASTQVGGHEDSNLSSVALLLSQDVTANEIRAASEGLSSYDGGVRLRRYDDGLTAERYSERLDLMVSWARQSGTELSVVANSASGLPFDRDATQAIYRAKARAYVAHRFLSYMQAPIGLSIKNEQEEALLALEKAAKFKPLIVLNGKADGLIFPSHPASLYHQMHEVELVLLKTSALVKSQIANVPS